MRADLQQGLCWATEMPQRDETDAGLAVSLPKALAQQPTVRLLHTLLLHQQQANTYCCF